jgi:hypothetical protein
MPVCHPDVEIVPDDADDFSALDRYRLRSRALLGSLLRCYLGGNHDAENQHSDSGHHELPCTASY